MAYHGFRISADPNVVLPVDLICSGAGGHRMRSQSHILVKQLHAGFLHTTTL